MLDRNLISTVFCTAVLALSACDKDESLGEVDSEGSSESDSETSSGTEGGECPADAMMCPDGTFVGRSGPDCEFDPCPGDSGGGTTSGGSTETGDESGGGTGGPVCAPDDEYLEPAACPSKEGNRYIIDAECQTACSVEMATCGTDEVCMAVEFNPCVCDGGDGIDCCAACAAEAFVCVPVSSGETCDAIVGQTFSSVQQQECGLGPDGIEMCSWTIEFNAGGTYEWSYSDVAEGGTYACKDGTVSLLENPNRAIAFDVDTGVLSWESIEYTATSM